MKCSLKDTGCTLHILNSSPKKLGKGAAFERLTPGCWFFSDQARGGTLCSSQLLPSHPILSNEGSPASLTPSRKAQLKPVLKPGASFSA